MTDQRAAATDTGPKAEDPSTGAPSDVIGGMPATDAPLSVDGASVVAGVADPLDAIGVGARRALAAVADLLIPAAHGMPAAGQIVRDDRLRFVLRARPDLIEPLQRALRPELGDDPQARIAVLERDAPTDLSALQLVIVGGYYTHKRVRELIGYPGQEAIQVRSWEYPPYLEEGLVDQMLARGPVWRDPATGKRAVATGAPKSYAERAWSAHPDTSRGGDDGRDRT